MNRETPGLAIHNLDPRLQMTVLVICRVEHSRKAPTWMKALNGFITFSCSAYGTELEAGVHHFRGGKWAGIYDFFRQQPELLQTYDYFWFPDDDIETTPDTASSFLSLCLKEGFELAQPALTPESYFAYRETIENPRFHFRRTNFVELMMPLMRQDFLLKVLPLFEGKHAALGIDWMWQRAAAKPCQNVAIIDASPMSHTRPRNQLLATKMNDQNISISEERAQTLKRYDIRPITPRTYSGQLKNGAYTQNKLRLAAELLLGYIIIKKKVTNGDWTAKHIAQLILRQLKRTAH
ncbi:hypothetical protein [Neorhizobium petrolearium]|uniref:hypothetical protein n=1 Tax=Neorhizobium petrolearium TaxID=515361 RepID=UPI003F13A94D